MPTLPSVRKNTIENLTKTNEMRKASLQDWPKELNIPEINERFGSPTWIISEEQLTFNVQQYERFTDDPGRIFYPVKTNPSLTVLQILAKLGVGADCASRLEINLALFAGIKMENISYNTPTQDVNICKELLLSGAKVVMDDVDALLHLQSLLKDTEFSGNLLLRVNLLDSIGYAHEADNQELLAHGHQSSKFGIPAEELEDLIPKIIVPISGLHVHVGTQMDNMNSFENAITQLNALAAELTQKGHSIQHINLGGGLGIPFAASDEFPSLEHWCDYMNTLKHNNYLYSVEPGHALVGNAGALLTQVQTLKNSRGKKWAVVNVGTDQLTKVTLLKWPHRILNASGEEFASGKDAIAGPLCFAGDILLDNISVSGLQKSTPLLITEVGAYTYSLANKFNGRLAPKWVLLQLDGTLIQTMEEESIYDELHFSKYEWNTLQQENTAQNIDLNTINKRSNFNQNEERFVYKNVHLESENRYKFIVSTSAPVDFISMSFAIKILEDAARVSILHKEGFSKSEFSIQSQKLTMDYFDNIKTNESLTFTISLSEILKNEAKHTIIARFQTSCGNCSGSFIISYRA